MTRAAAVVFLVEHQVVVKLEPIQQGERLLDRVGRVWMLAWAPITAPMSA